MDRIWLSFHTLAVFIVCVRAQSSIQMDLNNFCRNNPNLPGCENFSQASSLPSPQLLPSGPNVNIQQQQDTCSASSRKCPQLPGTFCVPRSIDCSAISSGQKCRMPAGFGYTSNVLMCGNGSPPGIRCVTGGTVPILTQLIVQCQGANQIDIQPVTNLGSVILPGEDGGAGVYRCGTSGSWEPLFGSPFLNELTKSCTNAGCGRVPHPGRNIHVHRRWSWVRALISQGEVRCTATLVSPTAAITAAHCLTRSLVSRQALDVRNFQLELPGPDELNPRIRVTPQSLHIHPRYLPQIGYQHDLAVITFRALDYALPTVCLAHNQLMPSDPNTQVVFKLDQSLAIFDVVSPSWRTSEANWFNSCQGLANPASSCQTQPVVNPSQFCASHPGLSMVAGSSGGPYLAEISKGVEEVWVIVGILSQFTNETSCDQSHTIYTQVADGTKWVRSCVFDGKCN